MNNIKIKLLIGLTTIQLITIVLFYSAIQNYESTISELEKDNIKLRYKIGLIEDSFNDFMSNKLTKSDNNTKNKIKLKRVEVVINNQNKNIEKKIFSFEESYDTIKNLPNRSGEDLINSLTLKVTR